MNSNISCTNSPTPFYLLFFCLFIFQTSVKAQLITEGLVGYWPFNGNMIDETGNGFDGINNVQAILAEDRFGNPNSAFDFTVNNTYISFGDVLDEIFEGPNAQFTMTAWIKPHVTNNINGPIIAKGADACDIASFEERMFFFRVFGPTSRLSFTFYSTLTSGNAHRVIGETEITNIDKWYHVAIVYDGTVDTNNGLDRVQLYVDCNKEQTSFETALGNLGNMNNTAAHLSLGNAVSSAGSSCTAAHNFKGLIDDVSIYNRMLTDDEIILLAEDQRSVSLGPDIVICENETTELIPDLVNYHLNDPFEWQDGSNNTTFTASAAGLHWVEVGDGCLFRDSVEVLLSSDNIQIDLDTTLCIGSELELPSPAEFDGLNFVWQDGSSDETLIVTEPGTYWVEVNENCTIRYSYEVSYPTIPAFELGADTTLCVGETFFLEAPANTLDGANFSWQDGSSTPTFQVFESGIYSLEICDLIEEIEVNFEVCEDCNLELPSAFTPNRDGLNDIFKPLTNCNLSSYQFQIFNRWGELVFQTNDINQGWDGQHNNKIAPSDVYVFKVDYLIENNDQQTESQIEAGDVFLIR